MLSRFRYILILCIALLGGLRAAAQIAMPDTVCIGATKHYWVNGSAGSTYTWAINGIPVSGSTNELYQSWLVVGNYTLTVQETSSSGCIGPVMSGEIIVNPTSSSNSTITACDSYFWNGTTYNTSGNYSFTLPGSSQYGCDSTAYLSLTVNPLVTPTFPGIGPLCQFSTAPFLPTNSNEGIPGTWTPSFVNTSLPGIASYTFTPAPGECAVPSIMNIMINEQPVLSIGSIINVTCFGGSNGSATVQIVGGLGPYSILWDDPALQTTATASALAAGTYTVLVTDANGCSVAETVTITQSAILNALFTTQNIGCFGAATGGISIFSPTGGSGSYEYSIDGINWTSSGTFSNLPPGTYTVLIRDANDISCQINLGTSVINQPAAPLSATATITPESCPSSSDGAIDLTVSGGTAPYTILWNTLAVTEDISGLPGGTYSVSINDANGCNYFNSFLVNTIPDITPPLVVCPPAVTLNTNANCEIIVPDFIALSTASDNCGTVTLLQSPVAGTVISGAIANQIITVTILASDPSGNTSSCSTNITVANHLPVAVDDIATTNEDTPILIPVLPNDNFGCDGPSSSSITISSPPGNGTATVNNGGTPLNPTDDQVLYTPNPNYNGTDSFTYTICDSNGDCVTATVNITIIATNDPPVTFNESITLCEGSSFAGTIFNGDYDPDGTALFSNTVLVSPPAHGTFIINAAGNYTYSSFAGYYGPEQAIVSICDNGIPGVECTNDTIFITIDAFTAAQAGADQALCEASSTLLNGNIPVAGNGVWSFISGPSVPILTPVSATSVNAGGLVTSLTPYVFAYTITNGTCTTSDQVSVFNYAQPTTSFAGPDQAICTVTPAIATMAANTPLIGTGVWTQLTGPSIATINNVNNPNTTISGLIEGTYMFDWTISNGVCNPSSSAVSITISEPAVVFAGPDATICETQGSYLIGSSSEIHTQSFVWSSSGTGSFDNAALLHPTYTPSAADIAAGSVILTLSANGHFPCPAVSDAMTLTISHQASASAGPDAIICETAGSYPLTNAVANQFTSVLWSTSGTGSFSNVNTVQPVYTPSAADIASGFVLLSITANSAAPCVTVYDTMRLDITRQALAFAGNNDLICETQGSYALTASTASYYSSLLWTTSGDGTFNNANLLNPVYTPGTNDIANGTATLTLTAYALIPCADAVSSMILNISRQATAFAGPDFNICETQSTVSLTGAAANHYTSLNWTTSGDGTFSNSTAVNPDYFPGPNDIVSGNVTLTMTAGSAAPCVTASDALNIFITRTVTADAGPDDEACQGVPYTINGSSAAFFSNIIWSHTGLGVLSAANSLHPTYVPSTLESGPVTFTFRAYSNAPCTDSIVDIMTLNVHPLPTATISGGTSICEGDTAMLRIDFTGIAPWTVTYTNGVAATTVSGIMSSPYLFSVIAPVGNINYTLTGLSDANCTATASQLHGSALVIVNPTPVTEFTVSSSCVNDTTFFVPSGAYIYKINHWTWNFGDGTYGVFNTPVSPIHIYPASGTYNVTLSVEDTVGCVYTISHPVTVRPLPTAYFNFSSPNCVGSATSFTDLSNNGTNQGFIQEWSWNFGDGTAIQTIQFPNTPNISHTFTLPGVYTVTLTVTNSNGCSSSYSNTVMVTPLPEAAFSFNTNCENEVTQFIDESTTNGTGQVNTWSWNFGDLLSGSSNVSNQQNPVHTYATAGTYLVTLVVSNFNGCIDSVQNMVTINPAPLAEFTSSAGCVGAPTSFWADTTVININTIATYAWDFGDGTTGFNRNAQHSYAAPGTYTVTLTITDLLGCSGTASHSVTVTTPPAANFFSNANSCNGLPVSFTDQSTATNGYITEWHWNFGDGTTQNILFPAIPNTSHTYALPGTYNVSLTVTNNLGCINTISHTIQVSGGPTANFYSSGNCKNSPVNFNDISTVTGMMSVASWNWNFGDPASGVSNTSNLQNPTHTYASAGTYFVSLLITTNSGCVDSVTRQIVIKPLPLVGFTSIGSCKGGLATFTPDPSVMNIFAVTSWNWSFGDGGSSTLQAPTHTYTSAGTFTVTLTVSDTTGCSNSISHPVTIGEPPVVAFSNSSPSCSGSDVMFADQTILNTGYIVRWNWNFGDGNSQTIYFPASAATSHQYLQSGNFNVVLTVYTSDSCSALFSRTITIGSAPNAAFTSSGSCQGTAVEFHDESTVAGSQITGRNWNFGDPASGSSNSSTLQNPSHVYSTAGTYNVQLIVTSTSGCTDTVSNSVTVGLPPTVDFSATSGCNGDTTQFISSSFVNMTTTQSWLWQFGDGQTSTLPDPIHIYAIAGTYSVTLTITSNGGCTASKTSQVTVSSGPLANFNAGTPSCNLSPVTFSDLTNANGNTITSWTWLFGDGNQVTYSAYTPSLQHTYTQAGNFIVKLTVHTQNGCENSFQQPVTISAAPVADFSYQNNCEGETTAFTDLTTITGSVAVTQWNWNFGDPGSGINNTSSLQNPQHTYTASGTYTASLISINAAGCADTMQKTVTISPKPGVDFFNDPATCLGSPVQFHTDTIATNILTVASYDWDFGDGSAHSNLQNPAHTYASAATYTVTLVITDESGCLNIASHSITVHELPVAAFTYNQSCVLSATNFNDLSIAAAGSSINAWHWDFGVNGILSDTSDLQNPSFTYTLPGTYTVSLTVTSAEGCNQTITAPVQIWHKPDANFRYTTTPCSNGAVQFQDSSFSFQSVVTTWTWEFEPYQYSSLRNPMHTFYKTDSCYNVSLIVTDLHGCADTTSKLVCVPAGLTADITYQSSCLGSPTSFASNLLTPAGDQIQSASWNFGDPASGVSNTSSQLNPAHTFSASGFYTINLTVTDIYGCQATATETIEVFTTPVASFTWTNTQFSTSVDFTSTSTIGSAAIATYNWNFGDGTSQVLLPPNTQVTHTYPVAGYYTVTLTITDKNGCTSTVSMQILCSPVPQASIDVQDTLICQNYPISIANTSSGAIDQWIWNWGDGTPIVTETSFNPMVSHTYSQAGTYTLSLKIISFYNGNPIADSAGRVINVIASPIAGFSFEKLCLGDQTQFADTTAMNGVAIASYNWNFGDAGSVSDTSSLRNPEHRYTSTGLFNASLVVTNISGCTDTVHNQVMVNGLPDARFTNSIACQGNETHFFDHSVPFADSIIHEGWRIGNDRVVGFMNGSSPSFTFDTLGVYPVQLAVTDRKGCIDTTMRYVQVSPSPISAFSILENYKDEQGHLLLQNGSLNGTEYYWDLGNGTVSYDESPEMLLNEDGRYVISLYTTNEYGCTDSIGAVYDMLFKGLYVPNAFAPGGPAQTTRYWKPVGVNLAYYKAEIYDRWDGLIWSSEALDEKGTPVEGWDGTVKGRPCKEGVYVWKITAIYRDGTIWRNNDIGNHTNMPELTTGTISLIR